MGERTTNNIPRMIRRAGKESCAAWIDAHPNATRKHGSLRKKEEARLGFFLCDDHGRREREAMSSPRWLFVLAYASKGYFTDGNAARKAFYARERFIAHLFIIHSQLVRIMYVSAGRIHNFFKFAELKSPLWNHLVGLKHLPCASDQVGFLRSFRATALRKLILISTTCPCAGSLLGDIIWTSPAQ